MRQLEFIVLLFIIMIDDLRAMAIFAETIRQGSFRGAAKELKLSPSVVSYHITRLERHLGTALIYRSTRKLSLTHQGEVLYQHAIDMLNAAKKALRSVQVHSGGLSGKVRLTLPSALTQSPITRKIADFALEHPNLTLDILFTDESQDLIEQRIDLAIRASDLADSAMKSKRIGAIERKLVCAPSYWDQQKPPKHPSELETWNWIKLDMLQNRRTIRQNGKPPTEITYISTISVNSVEAMTAFCRHGLGLATPPDFMVENDLVSGNLIEVFPDWRVDPIPLHALWLPNATKDRAVRGLLDHLSQ